MKQTRRQFIGATSAALAAAGSARVLAATDKPLFSCGLLADCQYVDAETRGSRFYRESPRKLEEAIDELNQRELAFTFHLGDFIDREFKSFDDLDPIAAKLTSKLHHALGNHDFEVADDDKAKVAGRLGLERGYYSFGKDGFRFVVIDTTDVSIYRRPATAEASHAAAAELKALKAAGSKSCSALEQPSGR